MDIRHVCIFDFSTETQSPSPQCMLAQIAVSGPQPPLFVSQVNVPLFSIEPVLPGTDVGDVGHPKVVGLRDSEISLHELGMSSAGLPAIYRRVR